MDGKPQKGQAIASPALPVFTLMGWKRYGLLTKPSGGLHRWPGCAD